MDPKEIHAEISMPVNLSVKNVPDILANRLRRRAERNHRSLQGELMAILEGALVPAERPSPAEILERVRELGLGTGDEASAMIRADRGWSAIDRATFRRGSWPLS